MKRILFVDDEIMVLKGLKRMLAPLRSDWEMHFATGGAEALAFLEATAVDVVVTDWRMPDMDGVCLLREVSKRHAGTVRIILTGQPLEESRGDCLFHAHQVLYKPCDFATLASVLHGILNADALLGNGLVKQKSAHLHSLPPLPGVYQDVVVEMGKPAPSMPRIAAIIRRDPGIASRILSIVNAVSFGLRSKIAALEHAIDLLGINTVRSIIVAMHCMSLHDAPRQPRFSLPLLWDHCMRTSGLAKHYAMHSQVDAEKTESCFIAAMLHDMGKIALAALFPKEYDQIIFTVQDEGRKVFEVEQQVFGTTHAEVGAFILGLWGMPEYIVSQVANHHAPERIGSDGEAIVFTANAMDHKQYIIHKDYTFRDYTPELARHRRYADLITTWISSTDTFYAELRQDEE